MSSTPGRSTVIAVFLVLTLVWGTTWAAIRVSLQGIPPFLGVSLRFGLAALVLLAIARVKRVPLGRQPHEHALWLATALLSFCGSYGIVYWAEQYVPSGLAAVIWACFPLMVAALAHLVLPAEPLSARALLGIVVGFGGLAVIYSEDLTALGGPRVALASVVLLLSPLVAAISSVAVRRWGRQIPAISIAAVPMAIAAVVMGALSAATERSLPVSWAPRPVAALVYLALAGSALTFSLYYWLLAHTSAVRTSLIAYTTPVVALLVGTVVLGEPVTARILAGAALVIGGVALATISGAPPGEADTPPA